MSDNLIYFFMAIGLSMDAFSLALAYGTTEITLRKKILLSLTVGILLGNEGLSILENASICGVPIPEKLKNMLEQYKDSKNKKS